MAFKKMEDDNVSILLDFSLLFGGETETGRLGIVIKVTSLLILKFLETEGLGKGAGSYS